LILSLSEEATMTRPENATLTVQTSLRRVTFNRMQTGVRSALHMLGNGGIEEDRLADAVLQSEGIEGLGLLHYALAQLDRRAMLRRSAYEGHECLATLVPTSPSFTYAGHNTDPARPYALSRFAYLHREGNQWWMESPLAHARLILHDWRATALIHFLRRPSVVAETLQEIPGLTSDAALAVMDLMLNASLLGEVGESGTPATDRRPALQSWELHDLLFHARSRQGRHDQPVGGTYRFAAELDPPPAVKPLPEGKRVTLVVPDLEELRREDPPFAWVQEKRRSVREYGKQAITAEQLGEFLYRVARVKELTDLEVQLPAGPLRMQFALRPYPGAGAMYEMEIYVAVNVCQGLSRGLYHYDAGEHRLTQLADRTNAVAPLLDDAGLASGIAAERLQVLLVLAARFCRLNWKYASMAYAAVLKDVGVLYQTMYLAATAMGLAPCALGCGDSEAFSRSAGTDYFAETSVGEFLLGSVTNMSGSEEKNPQTAP
jgi:SagB-type dehydrogenase family enzyme